MNEIRNYVKTKIGSESEVDIFKQVEVEPDTDCKINLYIIYYTMFMKYGKDYLKNREELDPQKWSTLREERVKKETKVVNKKKGIHRCPKCKSWYTNYQQLQTASADESMRVSVSCVDCGHHWKYS